jgi:MFS family permease
MEMKSKPKFYGWFLVGVLGLLYLLNLGFPLYGGIIAHSYMVKAISMPRATFGLGMTLFNICMGLMSPLVAISIVKWGIRQTFMIGSVLLVAGSIVMSQVTEPWHYFVGFGVLIGSGIGFGTAISFNTAVTRWFKRYRGRSIGIILSFGGIGSFIISPAMNKFMAFNGGVWQQAWLVIAGVCVLGALIAYLFIKERPEDLGQYPDGVAPDSSSGRDDVKGGLSTDHCWTAAEGYRTLTYWLIVIGSTAMFFPYFLVQAHWIFHLKGMGLSAANAAWAMGLFALMCVAGRLIGGWLVDILPSRFVFIMGLLAMCAGTASGIFANTTMMAYFASLCLGFGFGAAQTTMYTMIGNYFGPEAYPKLFGTAFMISLVIASFAAIIGGKMFDMFKNYTVAWETCMAISIIGAVAMFFAMPAKVKSPSPVLKTATHGN